MNHQQDYDDVLRARFTKWLDIVIYRAKLKYLRKMDTKLETISIEELPESSLPAYEESLYRNPLKTEFDFEEERLANAFMKLPMKRQQILTMLFVEEKMPEEIAKALNCSTQHVYDQKYQALKKLRLELSEEVDDL
ncbi:sigma-70 family RNA polymerase sigma factor [Ruthenibacterium lactatiformans]|uniref:sigma-70 family RNA polymerase sigma factor n=1 Tax=Ruthenibacterium lactatiformans TaxID=1550024 RepID=UPI0027BB0E5F|nr:sigma-70 family RNA polymerase sigma factor [Ruthenibacterium lactatiformans]